MELRKKVVSGFIWTAAEKFGSLAVFLCAQVILLRLLDPLEFGLVGMLTAFTAITYSVIDSGFSQALIQKKNATEKDFNSIFWLNMGIAIVLYAILVGGSGLIAGFYDTPMLTKLAPWIFLTLPVGGASLMQTTILTKRMDFRTISKANFISSCTASVVAVAMAFYGYGVWALVVQAVALYMVRTLVLWSFSDWRPRAAFSWGSVRGLFKLGSRLFAVGIITQLFNNFPLMLIGRHYSASGLGFYERAYKLRNAAADTIGLPAQNVTFPAFSSLQDEENKFALAGRKVVSVYSFILFPVMLGLIAIAPEGFLIAGQEKWMPAVPYFRILCLAALCLPLSNISINLLKAKGRGNLLLRMEIIKKIMGLAVILYAVTLSILAVAWAFLAWTFIEMVINLICAGRTTGYTFRQQMNDTLPYLLLSSLMFAAVMGVGFYLNSLSPYIILTAKLLTGLAVYTGLAWLVKPAAWGEIICLTKEWLANIMPGKRK